MLVMIVHKTCSNSAETVVAGVACASSVVGGRSALSARLARPADALVNETVLGHAGRAVDVAQVDDDGRSHLAFQPIEVERAKLRPLGHDHDRIGAARAGIGVGGICD